MALKKETKKPAAAAKKPAAAKAPAKAAAKPAAKAAKAAAPKSKAGAKEVEFKVYAPDSRSVCIAGDFSGWQQEPMKKGKDGHWTLKLKLGAGEHQYKLVFDGQYWETDKANPERVADGKGGENSIRRV